MIYEVATNQFIEAVDEGHAVAQFIERVSKASSASFDTRPLSCSGGAEAIIQIAEFHGGAS